MNKYRFTFILLFLSFAAAAEQINIADISLTWSDFRVLPRQASRPNNAYIQTSISYKLVSDVHDRKVGYRIQTQCFIDRGRTYVDEVFFAEASPTEKQKVLDHEKLHLVICFLQHKRLVNTLRAHNFRGGVKSELDSLLAVTLEDLRKANLAYDNETNHGLNAAQGKWERDLLLQLSELYGEHADYFSMVETSLEYTVANSKLNDPLNFDYQNAAEVFSYAFTNNRVVDAIPQYPVTVLKPFYATTDSSICIDGINFDRNFELNLTFAFDSRQDAYDPCVALEWGISDSLNAAASVAPAELRFMSIDDKSSKKSNVKKSYLKQRLESGVNVLTIRHLNKEYQVFLNGRFEKKHKSNVLIGKKMTVNVVKEFASLHSIALAYLP